jgi:predicted DNA binding protein
MRKLIIELKLKSPYLKTFDFLLDKVESIELLELLKLDFEKRIKMGIGAFNMKEGYTIEDIDVPNFMEMLTVLNKEGDRYICLIKVKYFKSLSSLAEKFNLDIIWDTPSIFTKEKMIVSVSGTEENLKKILELWKNFGEVKKISFVKSSYSEQSVLSCLTQKQRDIVIAAKQNGYYQYPRKINSKELSKKIGLSKPTVVQHLRKAEVRLIDNILAGY